MSEIMWYLSFSDWLISLSIIFSRAIHVVTKGKYFYIIFGFIVFDLIFIVFCPYYLAPLYTLPPSNHHTVVHVHETFFLIIHPSL